jgi:hypothetical protein
MSAAMTPEAKVAMEHARRVVMPPPHSTQNHRSTPPMRPAIMAAGPPNARPATTGAASRTLSTPPSTIVGPVSVA